MFQVQGDGDIIYHENQTVEAAMAADRTNCASKAAEAQRGTKHERTTFCFVTGISPIWINWMSTGQTAALKPFEKAVTSMQPADVLNEVKSFRFARPWRGGFSDRREMEFSAQ